MSTLAQPDLLSTARDLASILRANAQRSDRDGRLPAESVTAMRDAGLFRLYVPRSLGGLQVDPVTHARIQEELSRHDSAAGWMLQASASSAWWCSRLPTETAQEIYADPDTTLAVSFPFPFEGEAVDGGLRLSGQRPFASNVSDASWIWVTSLTMVNGEPVLVDGAPMVRAAFFPASDAKIVKTWDTLGMRGTDSNDVSVEDLFVPERRTFRIGIDHTPGPFYDDPLYRVPAMVCVGSYAPAVALGMARDAIDEFVALAQGKTPFASSTTLRERATAQAKLGRADGLLRSARTTSTTGSRGRGNRPYPGRNSPWSSGPRCCWHPCRPLRRPRRRSTSCTRRQAPAPSPPSAAGWSSTSATPTCYVNRASSPKAALKRSVRSSSACRRTWASSPSEASTLTSPGLPSLQDKGWATLSTQARGTTSPDWGRQTRRENRR